MSIVSGTLSHPAADFAAAVERFEALRALDGPHIIAQARSRFYTQAGRTPLAVVLFHGLTNAPEQWSLFASQLHGRGHTVIVPRLPGHGHVDRHATAIASVTAADLLATASEATDIACGAGERVVVAGLSIGGAIAAWLGLHRADVARSVSIVPLFGIKQLNAPGNALLTAMLGCLPNAFVPWKPGDPNSPDVPVYGYPRFPTRLLAECLRIGLDVYRDAAGRAPAGSVTMVINPREPSCNNAMTREIAARFERLRPGAADIVAIAGLPANHDIIDPTNPHACVQLVYPRLLEVIERELR